MLQTIFVHFSLTYEPSSCMQQPTHHGERGAKVFQNPFMHVEVIA